MNLLIQFKGNEIPIAIDFEGIINSIQIKMNSDIYCLSEKEGNCYMCSTTMIEPYQCEQKSTEEENLKRVTEDETNGENNDENESVSYKISCYMNSAV